MLCTSYFLALIARAEFRNCGYWSSATVLELMSDAYIGAKLWAACNVVARAIFKLDMAAKQLQSKCA